MDQKAANAGSIKTESNGTVTNNASATPAREIPLHSDSVSSAGHNKDDFKAVPIDMPDGSVVDPPTGIKLPEYTRTASDPPKSMPVPVFGGYNHPYYRAHSEVA